MKLEPKLSFLGGSKRLASPTALSWEGGKQTLPGLKGALEMS